MRNFAYRGSLGGFKAWAAFFVIAFLVVYFGFFKIGPAYRDKWNLEDEMQEILSRFVVYNASSEDPYFDMLSDLRKYTTTKGLPFDPLYETSPGVYACSINAEAGKAGSFVCPYTVNITFPGYVYKMPMEARVEMDHIPSTSF